MSIRHTVSAFRWLSPPLCRGCHRNIIAAVHRKSFSSRRSPTARSRESLRTKRLDRYLDESSIEAALTIFSMYGETLYFSAKASTVIPNISFRTFSHLAKRILEEVDNGPPSSQAAMRISRDVDLVFSIAQVLEKIDERILIWAAHATSAAGAALPTMFLVVKHLRSVTFPLPTKNLDLVEQWAIRDHDPRAIALHSKVLGKREQYQEALVLLEKVMECTYPTRLQPSTFEDVTLRGLLEPPWQLYAWLKESIGDQKATNAMLEMAALKYHDPKALVDYAHLMRVQGNTAMYEECMSKAATAGNPEACRKLANFYFLTFLGRLPSQQSDDRSFRARISRFFGQSRTPEDYRKLAVNWYELAFAHGSNKAALILAILLREAGHLELGLEYLKHAEEGRRFPKLIAQLKKNWESDDVQFSVPDQLLDI